jgi:hypothetical protein
MIERPKMAEEGNARWCILIAIVLTLCANIPLLVLNTDMVFIDDWAWIWVTHWKGAAALREIYWQAAHPWFGPLFNILFWLGGETPGRFGRSVELAFHLANGWLLWRIFNEGRSTPAFATTVAILFLASPFLGGYRATLNPCDILIFFYLLSILLSGRSNIFAYVGSLVTLAIGIGVETLAALEPIRWWYLYKSGNSPAAVVRKAWPFVLIVSVVAVSRATWMAPYGVYAGHNSLKPFVLSNFIHHIVLHLNYFVDAFEPTRYVVDLFVYDNGVIVIYIALLAGLIAYWQFRLRGLPDHRDAMRLLLLGLVVLTFGMLPYVATERNPPGWKGFYAYLAVASQFGVLILAALLISILPARILRGAVVGFIAFVFSAMQVQFGKWALYDDQVLADFHAQLATEFKSNERELLIVRFIPASNDILFLKTCLANYAMNVALDVRGLRNGSFAYDYDCGGEMYTKAGKCGVAGYELVPCPPKKTAEFLINPGMEDFTQFRLVDLASRSLFGPNLSVGTLVVQR